MNLIKKENILNIGERKIEFPFEEKNISFSSSFQK
jgi:hypothetical protein